MEDQPLVTVRFLELLMRLPRAHVRLMYRDKVFLDDDVAIILLMECTTAASNGGDYSLHKNPMGNEFIRFKLADEMFEDC